MSALGEGPRLSGIDAARIRSAADTTHASNPHAVREAAE